MKVRGVTVIIHGGTIVKSLPTEIEERIRALHGKCEEREEIVYRITVNGQCYHSYEYKRVKKRNTYTIEYRDRDVPKFGLVLYYVFMAQDCLLAVVKELEIIDKTCKDCFNLTTSALDTLSGLGKITPVRSSARLHVIYVTDILQKTLYIDDDGFSDQFVVNISPLLLTLHY